MESWKSVSKTVKKSNCPKMWRRERWKVGKVCQKRSKNPIVLKCGGWRGGKLEKCVKNGQKIQLSYNVEEGEVESWKSVSKTVKKSNCPKMWRRERWKVGKVCQKRSKNPIVLKCGGGRGGKLEKCVKNGQKIQLS